MTIVIILMTIIVTILMKIIVIILITILIIILMTIVITIKYSKQPLYLMIASVPNCT